MLSLTSTEQVPLNHGATATLDHTAPLGDQVDTIKKVTEGKFGKVFDASARAHETGLAALEQVSTASEKLFSTANTWFVPSSPFSPTFPSPTKAFHTSPGFP
jgi:hypothetical protein